MKAALNTARLLVGVLFIFSGLIKANDPLGLSYKMQEFFEVWGWEALNDYTLTFSVLMNAFEIIAGVAVLVGWRMRLFSWLLLLLILFFTFLTAYALFSGKIRTCGCFGDCIPLTAQTSFIKDILLLLLILFLFANRTRISSGLSSSSSLILLVIAAVFSFGAQWYVLKHLPVLDCLPYKKGNNLPEKMKIPAGAIPDSTVISFVYNKQGKEVEFTADKFPEDFDDSLYQFIKRYDKIVRKGNATPAINDFSLKTLDGVDSTQELLATPGYMLLLFLKDEAKKEDSYQEDLAIVYNIAKSKNIPLHLVTNNKELATSYFISNGRDILGKPDRALLCDGVAIKTAARANPTLYLLRQGTVMGKWSWADLSKAAKTLARLQ